MATKQENLDYLISVNVLEKDSKVADFTADQLNSLVEEYNSGGKEEKEDEEVDKVEEIEVIEDDTVYVGKERNHWEVICKASSESKGFTKTTRALKIGDGVLIQVTIETEKGVSVALSHIPSARIIKCEIEKCSYIS